MYPVQMHTGIKQIYWYSSCLSSHSPWAKPWGTAEAMQHYRLIINTRNRTADVGMPSQKSDSQTHPSLYAPAEPAMSFQVKEAFCCNREAALAHWNSQRNVAQECNVFALGACSLVSRKKIWMYPTLTPGRKKHLRKLPVLVWLIQKPHCLLKCQLSWP